MALNRILVVDNEPLMRKFVGETLKNCGYEVRCAEYGSDAIETLKKDTFDIAFVDIKLPDITGIELLRCSLAIKQEMPVVMMTAYANLENVFEAIKLGATDYVIKPFCPDQIEIIVKRIIERQQMLEEKRLLRDELARRRGFGEIVGESDSIIHLLRAIKKAGETSQPILISGENGTGKKLTAMAIHRQSNLMLRPFIEIKCGDITEDFFNREFCETDPKHNDESNNEKECFHKKTVLFDGIGDMTPELQKHLAELIDRLKSKAIRSKCRNHDCMHIICTLKTVEEDIPVKKPASNDLIKKLESNQIEIPPLRERIEDIPLLAEYFIKEYCKDNCIQGKTLSKITITKLMTYSYPGNIAELRNVICRAIVLSGDSVIRPEHILFGESEENRNKDIEESKEIIGEAGIPLYEMERRLILKTLKSFSGNRGMTADALKISVRTLRNKLNQYRKMNALLV